MGLVGAHQLPLGAAQAVEVRLGVVGVACERSLSGTNGAPQTHVQMTFQSSLGDLHGWSVAQSAEFLHYCNCEVGDVKKRP